MLMGTLLLLMGLLLGACGEGSSEQSEVKSLYESVMNTHDEVMPRMGTIQQLKKSLSNYSAQIVDGEVSPPEGTLKRISELQTKLDEADELMRDWMHNFDAQKALSKPEDALSYLKQEQKRIEMVSTSMQESIAEAEAFLAAVPGEKE